jgi:hypothetical protein
MQLETILNRVLKFKSFVYGNIRFSEVDGALRILVEISARANSSPISAAAQLPP